MSFPASQSASVRSFDLSFAARPVSTQPLELARALVGLARTWESAFLGRRVAAERALSVWTGPAAEDFAARLRSEIDRGHRLCDELRVQADRWAAAWADQVDEENRRAWEASIAAGWPMSAAPNPVPVPVGPAYGPTTGDVR